MRTMVTVFFTIITIAKGDIKTNYNEMTAFEKNTPNCYKIPTKRNESIMFSGFVLVSRY